MAFQIPTDIYFSRQWHLLNNGQTGGREGVDLNVLPAWEYYRGSGIKIGIYDSGVYVDHEDLITNWDVNLQPIINGERLGPNPLTNPYTTDEGDAHGTAVAGLIAAPINGIGVVGVAPEAKYGASLDSTYPSRLYVGQLNQLGLYDIANHSYGDEDFTISWKANAQIRNKFLISTETGRNGLGVIHVKSAGNERGTGSYTSSDADANMRQIVTIAAGSDLGDIVYYSTPGPSVLVTAPVDVNKILGPQYQQWEREVTTPDRFFDKSTTTDIPGKEYGFSRLNDEFLKASLPPDYSYTTLMNGTSAAAPMVSGVVSLMLEANPELGYRDVQEILAISSRSPWQVGEYELFPWQTNGADYYNGGGFRYSHDYGFGFVDAAAAVRLSESWKEQRTSANEMMVQGGTSPFVLDAQIPADINEKVSFKWDISSEITVEWIELEADMTHSWWGDLGMTLTSPSGTRHTLLNRIGVTPDFVGPLNPDTNAVNLYGLEGTGQINQPFASTVSRGESSIGQWVLEINGRSTDQGGRGGKGILGSVQLSLFGSESPSSSYENTPTYYYTDRYAELLKLEPERLGRLEGDFGSNAALNFAASSEAVVVNLLDTQAQLSDVRIPIADSSEIEAVFGGGAGDKLTAAKQGSSLYGGWGNDQLFGRMGRDFLCGGLGNDHIRAGMGRDVVTGGEGADEIHGGFGRNTFKSEVDGYSDRLVIQSDDWLVNPLSGTAGNNPNGGKADVLKGLDSIDKIKIIGVVTADISVRSGATAHGLTGIGIFAKGALEALYTGSDLSVAQIQSMTIGQL
jgi:Ca2+-binding RTX toxin-like protein